MEIIDTQIHEIGPRLTWAEGEQLRRDVLSEVNLGWVDAVGVDVAILNPLDEDWATQLIRAFPDRFMAVLSVRDATRPDLDEYVAGIRQQQNVLGLRTGFGKLLSDPEAAVGRERLRSGYFDRLFDACERHEVPLFVFAAGNIAEIPTILDSRPGLTLIIDHLGMQQPPLHPREVPPWASLPMLLSLSKYPGVAVKVCGVPVFSDETYPFADVWRPMRDLLDAYGPERLMWASDISRFQGRMGWNNDHPKARLIYPGRHSYAESLFMIRDTDQLTEDEKAWILGKAARKVLRWESTN